jgi:hypothetical protein
MSTFKLKVRHRGTKKEVEVTAHDDYFGRHQYGYETHLDGHNTEILSEEEFHKRFEPLVVKDRSIKVK